MINRQIPNDLNERTFKFALRIIKFLQKKDFIHCVVICKKEAKETKYWLDLLFEINPSLQSRMLELQKETLELLKIFSTMIKNAQRKLELGA